MAGMEFFNCEFDLARSTAIASDGYRPTVV